MFVPIKTVSLKFGLFESFVLIPKDYKVQKRKGASQKPGLTVDETHCDVVLHSVNSLQVVGVYRDL